MSDWLAPRPKDMQFDSLEQMYGFAKRRSDNSTPHLTDTDNLGTVRGDGDSMGVLFAQRAGKPYDLTRWSAGQLCTTIGMPFSFLTRLAGFGKVGLELGMVNVNYLLTQMEGKKLLAYLDDGFKRVRAFNSPDYGRIYDDTVIEAVMRSTRGNWVVPSDVPDKPFKGSKCLYMSEHDMNIFLIDPRAYLIAGRNYYRGIRVWNSEVGAATWGVESYFHARGCANLLIIGRIVGSAMRIVHRVNAPERFMREGKEVLWEIAETGHDEAVALIEAASERKVAGKDDDLMNFLTRRGYTRPHVNGAVDLARKEHAPMETLLDIVNGLTRYAARHEHIDTKVDEAARATALLKAA